MGNNHGGSFGDAFYCNKPTGSHDIFLGVSLAPDPPEPQYYLNVRLTNGDSYYTATGNSISASLTSVDQGVPALLSNAWPMKITDGSTVYGGLSAPVHVMFASGGIAFATTQVSGKPVLKVDMATGSISSLATEDTMAKILRSQSRWKKRFDIQSTVSYVGYAPNGTATSSSGWTIKKTTFDLSGNPIEETWTTENTAVWDNRASESYS